MTAFKVSVASFILGVLVTVFALYPMLKGTMREQKYGLLLTPEEVKATCGKPQAEDWYQLTYNIKRITLLQSQEFHFAGHRSSIF